MYTIVYVCMFVGKKCLALSQYFRVHIRIAYNFTSPANFKICFRNFESILVLKKDKFSVVTNTPRQLEVSDRDAKRSLLREYFVFGHNNLDGFVITKINYFVRVSKVLGNFKIVSLRPQIRDASNDNANLAISANFCRRFSTVIGRM